MNGQPCFWVKLKILVLKYHNKNALCAFRSRSKVHPPFLPIFSGHFKKVFGLFHSDGSGEPNDDQQSQHLHSDGSGCCGSLRTNIRLSQPSSLFGNLVSHNAQEKLRITCTRTKIDLVLIFGLFCSNISVE